MFTFNRKILKIRNLQRT